MEFLNKLQRDVKQPQQTIQKEGDELVGRIRAVTSKSNIEMRRGQIEKVIEEKVKQFEPAVIKFIRDVKQNAAKAGIDLGDIDVKLEKAADAAKKKLYASLKPRTGARKVTKSKAKKTAAKSEGSARSAKKTTKKAGTSKKASKAT